MRRLAFSVFFLLWAAADARAACQKIPDLIAQLRPHPVERYFTRELIPLPFEELVSKATLVVEGTVRPIKTALTEDQCYLYTDYEVSPRAILFGKTPATKTPGPQPLVVRLIGGQTMIDGVKVIVRDEQLPPLDPGQHVMLFLTTTEKTNIYEPVGGILGAFKLTAAGHIESLVREKGIYEDVAALPKSALANEVKRIKSGGD